MATKLVPFESNPDVLNKFLTKLGVTEVPSQYKFYDVLGLDDDMLGMVPQPAIALLFLLACTDKYEKFCADKVKAAGAQTVSPSVYFTEQSVSNACGTVAVIHALANNTDKLTPEANKCLGKFLEATKGMSPSERAKYLETDLGIIQAHEELAKEGQTSAPDREEKSSNHFVAFVAKDGALYELDGRKPIPINHGPTGADTFLKDAAKVCKEYMANDPTEVNFTMIALAKA